MRNLKGNTLHICKGSVILILALFLALSALCCPAVAEEPESVTMEEISIDTSDVNFSNDDAAAMYINRIMSGTANIKTRGSAGGAGLNEREKKLYDALKTQITAVANGDCASTRLFVKFSVVFEKDTYTLEELEISNPDDWFSSMVDVHKVLQALLTDCPYDLYWYDKTRGSSFGMSGYYQINDNSGSVIGIEIADYDSNGGMYIAMVVAGEYRPATYDEGVTDQDKPFIFDTTYGTSAATAAQNARDIVTANKDLGDEAKLIAYKDAICGLTDYNDDAANPEIVTPYGNPWQMIWVFDNNSSTNVVCEGYSKAFQYLCDNSTFQSSKVKSIIVTGTMEGATGAGGHMWNVVTMPDDHRYIADITNSDAGSVGQDGGLFLSGYTTKNNNTYTYTINENNVYYVYNSETISLYDSNELSVNNRDYSPIRDSGTLRMNDGTVDWTLNYVGVLNISGTGIIDMSPTYNFPWKSYRNDIVEIRVGTGITEIGNHAFDYFSAVTTVSLPDGLTTIGLGVFSDCTSLTSITIPDTVTRIGPTTFSECSSLTSISLPANLTAIEYYMFKDCPNLAIVSVPSKVTSIDNGVFWGCTKLEDITLPAGLQSLGSSAFQDCTSLESIVIPDGVTILYQDTFAGCSSLSSVTLPSALTKIGDYAFNNCCSLSEIDIPNTVTTIGEGAFDKSTTIFAACNSVAASWATTNNYNLTVVHTWGEATYTWAEDRSTVTASRVCGRDNTHKEEETVNTASEITKPATCTEDGVKTYSATFNNAAFSVQTATETIAALGHSYEDPVYVWSEDNSQVTATRVCSRDETHVETETVNAASAVKTPATCETKGVTTYTATFTQEGFTVQTKDVEDIAALGHDWGQATYTWAEDRSTVTASRVCGRDNTHKEEETINTASEITKPATCTEDGIKTYTAAFNNAAFSVQTATEEIAALGHSYEDPAYVWSEDNSQVTATRVCSRDGSHIETETVDVTAETTKAATCEEKGETTYTSASFGNTAFTVQTKTIDNIDALGHDWSEASYTWAEDNSTATAARSCSRDNSHIETETVVTAFEDTTPATCTTAGERMYTAEFENEAFSDQTKIETIDALGHDLTAHAEVAATCTAEGNIAYWTCSRCGKIFSDEEGTEEITADETVLSKIPHVLSHTAEAEATCTEEGNIEYWSCGVCGKYFSDSKGNTEIAQADTVIAKQPHSLTECVPVPPTCSTDGHSGYWICADCGGCFTDEAGTQPTTLEAVKIPAAHTLKKTEKVEATCTATGTEAYWTCEACHKLFSDEAATVEIDAPVVIPAKGHKEAKDAAVAATCTETGLTEGKHCTVCNEVLVAQEVVPAKGHKEAKDAAVAATCTKTGLTEGKHCTVCNEVLVAQKVVPANGHKEAKDAAVAATCTETGLTEGSHCSVCGTVIKAQATVAAKGHTVVTDAAKAATCTESGLTESSHCSVCGTVIKAQTTVAAKGHTVVTDAAKAATCTESGLTEGSHCSVCGAVIKAQETVPAKGHTLVDGKCTVCGYIDPEAKIILGESGWVEKDGNWYYGDDDGCAVVGPTAVDGAAYCFNEKGEMVTGWEEVGDKWYYAQPSGVLYNSGWMEVDGTWYYFKANGELAVGWISYGGEYYYMKKDGTMATGWVEDSGDWYLLGDDGAMVTGWVQYGSDWYLLKPSGALALGWYNDGGTWYYFRDSGALATGWVQDGEDWYYIESSGDIRTGWMQDGGNWYYFKSSGVMATEWNRIGGEWYYFRDSGAMVTGWFRDKKAERKLPEEQKREMWFWFDESGVMATGWKEIDHQWEMFDEKTGEWLYTWQGN